MAASSAFTIRQALAADAPLIAQVHVASWRAAYPGIVPAEVLAALDEQEFGARWQSRLAEHPRLLILVAERQGQICGFASGGAIREGVPPYDAELYALYLLPSAQGQGIGRALFFAIGNSLHKGGHEHLLLWAFRENSAANFYRKLGGVLVSDGSVTMGGLDIPTVSYGWLHFADTLLA